MKRLHDMPVYCNWTMDEHVDGDVTGDLWVLGHTAEYGWGLADRVVDLVIFVKDGRLRCRLQHADAFLIEACDNASAFIANAEAELEEVLCRAT